MSYTKLQYANDVERVAKAILPAVEEFEYRDAIERAAISQIEPSLFLFALFDVKPEDRKAVDGYFKDLEPEARQALARIVVRDSHKFVVGQRLTQNFRDELQTLMFPQLDSDDLQADRRHNRPAPSQTVPDEPNDVFLSRKAALLYAVTFPDHVEGSVWQRIVKFYLDDPTMGEEFPLPDKASRVTFTDLIIANRDSDFVEDLWRRGFIDSGQVIAYGSECSPELFSNAVSAELAWAADYKQTSERSASLGSIVYHVTSTLEKDKADGLAKWKELFHLMADPLNELDPASRRILYRQVTEIALHETPKGSDFYRKPNKIELTALRVLHLVSSRAIDFAYGTEGNEERTAIEMHDKVHAYLETYGRVVYQTFNDRPLYERPDGIKEPKIGLNNPRMLEVTVPSLSFPDPM